MNPVNPLAPTIYPTDIESIMVLKDASSHDYGARPQWWPGCHYKIGGMNTKPSTKVNARSRFQIGHDFRNV